jgi:hypothetical protein
MTLVAEAFSTQEPDLVPPGLPGDSRRSITSITTVFAYEALHIRKGSMMLPGPGPVPVLVQSSLTYPLGSPIKTYTNSTDSHNGWELWNIAEPPNPPAFQIIASGVAMVASNPPAYEDVTLEFSATGSTGPWHEMTSWLVFPHSITNLDFTQSGHEHQSRTVTVDLTPYGYQAGWGLGLRFQLMVHSTLEHIPHDAITSVGVQVTQPPG